MLSTVMLLVEKAQQTESVEVMMWILFALMMIALAIIIVMVFQPIFAYKKWRRENSKILDRWPPDHLRR